jgi:hypothetical protein
MLLLGSLRSLEFFVTYKLRYEFYALNAKISRLQAVLVQASLGALVLYNNKAASAQYVGDKIKISRPGIWKYNNLSY